VVVVHGFKGFMEWGFFPPLAELLAARGVLVVRFNLAGAGMAPGDELVTDVRAFRDDTYTREVDEVLAVVQALRFDRLGGAADGADPSRLALFGHSRGGGVAVLAAERAEAGAIVTWNAISTIARHSEAELEVWRRRGELPVVNGRTGQVLALGPALLAEVENPPPELDILAAAAEIDTPGLILHGNDDQTVPIAEGRRLAAARAERLRLVEIPGGDHTFGAKHPFSGPTPALIRAMNETQRFLLAQLTGHPRATPTSTRYPVPGTL
jgi:pimeloyl-ACP methyl ester carboxylesterase